MTLTEYTMLHLTIKFKKCKTRFKKIFVAKKIF